MVFFRFIDSDKKPLEMPGIEPGAFHMQSERATTALHPPHITDLLEGTL